MNISLTGKSYFANVRLCWHNSLCDIYSDLCERCRAADAQRLVRKAARKSGSGSLPRNNFEFLPVEDAGDAAEVLQESKLECQQCNETAQTVCQGQRNALQIEDDTMSVAIETIMILGVSIPEIS